MKLEGARVVVVGMARSGVAAVELLREKGAIVRAVDQKPAMAGVEPQTEAAFADAELIVLSPGVPADLADLEGARSRGVRVIGDLELALLLEEVRRALDSQSQLSRSADPRGLRILEATDVRGLRFRAVFIAGLIEGGFPLRAARAP